MLLIESMNQLLFKSHVSKIIKINNFSYEFGLILSEKNVIEIINERNRVLKVYERIDFDSSIIEKILNSFYCSPYILQENYVQTINELIELFYYIKNDVNDEIGDDELISIMEDLFNSACHGDLNYLKDLMVIYANNIRYFIYNINIEDEFEDEEDFIDE
jgi:hypothetical protein